MKSGLRLGGKFVADCYDRYGNKKWSATGHNMVFNTAIQKILDITFADDTDIISTWYVGLMATTAVAAGDSITTKSFTEATEYSQANRPIFVDGRTNQTVSNTGNLATFSINKDATTIEGAFLVSSNSIGGTTGLLLSAAPFTGGVKVGDSGDSLRVTYTFVGSDDTSS